MTPLSHRDQLPVDGKALCTCGRYRDKLHCPNCGSADTYGYSHKVRIRLKDGKRMTLRKYRCRRCGQTFTDHERTMCRAPAVYGKAQLTFDDSPQVPIEELFEQARATDRLDTIRNKNR